MEIWRKKSLGSRTLEKLLVQYGRSGIKKNSKHVRNGIIRAEDIWFGI